MNVHEVAGLLAYFGSAWPNMELPDDTADVWAHELADVNIEYGREASKNLVRSLKFFPSIAEFLEECRLVGLSHRARQPHTALPEAPSDPADVPHEVIATVRAKLEVFTIKGRAPKPKEGCSEVVELPKQRCSRCGQMTMPYTWTLEPKEVEPMQPYTDGAA